MKSRWPIRLLRIGVWVTIAGLIAAFTLFEVARTAWFRRVVREKVQTGIERATGGKATLSGMTFNPLLLRMTFRRVVVRGPEASSKTPWLDARSVFVQFDPWALMHGKLGVRSFSWASADLHVETGPRASAPQAVRAPNAPGKLTPSIHWSVHSMNLAHTRIFWNDRRIPLSVQLEGVTVLVQEGASRRLEGDLSSNHTIARFRGIGFPTFRFAAHFTTSRTGVRCVIRSLAAGNLQGSGEIQVERSPAPHVTFTLSLSGGLAPLVQPLQLNYLRGGKTALNVHGKYNSGALQMNGVWRIRDAQIRSRFSALSRMDFDSQFSATSQGLDFQHFRLTTFGASLSGRAGVSWVGTSPAFEIKSKLAMADLGRSMQFFDLARSASGMFHPAAYVAGSANVSWQGDFTDFQADLQARLMPYRHFAPTSLPVSGVIKAHVENRGGLSVQIEKCKIQSPASKLVAQGALTNGQSSVVVRARTTNFDEWRPIMSAIVPLPPDALESSNSPAAFDGTISAPMGHPRVQGTLTADHIRIEGESADQLSTKINLASNSARLSGALVVQPSSALDFDLGASLDNWEFTQHNAFRLDLALRKNPVLGFEQAAGMKPQIEGTATGQLTFQGNGNQVVGSGQVTITPFVVRGEALDSASAQIRLASGVWSFNPIIIVADGGRITGQAQVDSSRRFFSLTLDGNSIELDKLHSLATQPIPAAQRLARADLKQTAPRSGPPPLSGAADFSLRVTGWIPNWTADLQAQIQNLALRGVATGNLNARANWKDGVASFNGELTRSNSSLNFHGHTAASSRWNAEVAGKFSNFALSPYMAILSSAMRGAKLNASGDFEFSGPLSAPHKISGHANIGRMAFNLSGVTWENTEPIFVHYSSGALVFAPFRVRGTGTDFTVNGSASFVGTKRLHFDAQGRADAAALSLLDPAIHATGDSTLSLQMLGTVTRPRFQGNMMVRNVNFGYGQLPLHVAGLHGEIVFKDNRALLENLKGRSGGGTVSASGSFTLGALPQYDLQARFNQVEVRYFQDFTPLLDGSLRLAGSGSKAALTGDIRLRDLLVNPSFSPLDWLGSLGGPPSFDFGGASSRLASHIKLSVLVSTPDPVRFVASQFELTGTANLRVEGNLAEPVTRGSVDMTTGQATFRGNRYQLVRGEISLPNPYRAEPVLDLEATTRVDNYDLTIEISGPLDRLKLSYRSDPPLPEQQIVTLLTLGYARQQQGLTQGGAHSFSSVGASAALSQALSNQVSARIERIFGVSRVEISPSTQIPGAGTGSLVTIEEQPSRDLTVTYSEDTSNSQYRVVRFVWSVTDRVSLVGIRDINGVFGIELKFHQRLH